MKLWSIVSACAFAGLTFCAGAHAQQFYDNWNTAACGFTDRAGFQLHRPTHLTAIEIWYRWGRHQSEARYELFEDGNFIQRGHLMRAGCDPYQESWCGGRTDVGLDLPRGYVELRTDRERICQNAGSNGEGFIRAYGMHHHEHD